MTLIRPRMNFARVTVVREGGAEVANRQTESGMRVADHEHRGQTTIVEESEQGYNVSRMMKKATTSFRSRRSSMTTSEA